MRTQADRSLQVLFLDHLAKRWPGVGDTPALKAKAKALLRFAQRVESALEEAGYPKAEPAQDPRFARAGYILHEHAPDPFGQWALVLTHCDLQSADFMTWMARYNAVLRQAGIPNHVNPIGALPGTQVTNWGEIHIWMTPSEVEK